MQLKEKNGGKVTGIIFGTEKSNSAMKEAYAMGVDEGFIITGAGTVFMGFLPAAIICRTGGKMP